MLRQIILYFQTDSDRWLTMLTDHLLVSAVSLVIAGAIAIPTGVLCSRYRSLKKIFEAIFGTLRIIPSLAILLLMLPVMGTGFWSAVTALVLLAIPPVLINTIAGLDAVPDFILETARGMGMESCQLWFRVRLPLALPMILSGMKTSAVEIIASAALAAKIGAGGFGELIFTGIGLFQTDLLLIGGGSVAILSLLTGVLFGGMGRVLLRYENR